MAIKKMTQFFQEVQFELSRVEWPKFDEWVGSTIIVLVLVCFFAIYLGVIDFGLVKFVSYVISVYGGY